MFVVYAPNSMIYKFFYVSLFHDNSESECLLDPNSFHVLSYCF